jgi:hypothetical protein
VNFWCIFESHFFLVYYFSSKQEACQEMLCEEEVNEIMPGCHPTYLKTVSLQVVFKLLVFNFFFNLQTHSLRFLTPNTAVLVGIIQIHTNFSWLKWLHTKKNLYLGWIFALFSHEKLSSKKLTLCS